MGEEVLPDDVQLEAPLSLPSPQRGREEDRVDQHRQQHEHDDSADPPARMAYGDGPKLCLAASGVEIGHWDRSGVQLVAPLITGLLMAPAEAPHLSRILL
jgi:hypothetical protein